MRSFLRGMSLSSKSKKAGPKRPLGSYTGPSSCQQRTHRYGSKLLLAVVPQIPERPHRRAALAVDPLGVLAVREPTLHRLDVFLVVLLPAALLVDAVLAGRRGMPALAVV